MKKLLFIGALCALFFTGCKDDSEPDFSGVEDADYTGIVLNEVCGGDADSKDDWIEIYNSSENAVSLEGVRLLKTDEEGVTVTLYTFSKEEVIAGKSYVVKGKENLAASISNSKSVVITLQAPSGADIDEFDRDVMIDGGNGHALGGSYARNNDGEWTIVTVATKGSDNIVNEGGQPDTPVVGDYTGLALNELNGNDPKYIELYNNSNKEMDITGIQIKKDASDIVYVAPKDTKIAAHGYLVLLADQEDYTTGFTSGLSAKKSVMIELLSPDGNNRIDVFKNLKEDGSETWGDKKPKYNGETENMAFARKVDGTGKWYMMKATKGTSNELTEETGDEIVWE